jgi:hypothetical protein
MKSNLSEVTHEAARDNLADLFASALPGVEERLLIPIWRLRGEQPRKPTFAKDRAEPTVITHFDNRPHPVIAEVARPERKSCALP